MAKTLLITKERRDLELSTMLRAQGIIKTSGAPFEASRNQEIYGLIARNVFEFLPYDPVKMSKYRLFNSRLVN